MGQSVNFYKMGQAMGPDKIDTSTADALGRIGGQARSIGIALAAERKAEEKKLKEEKNKAGNKISQAFVDMGPTLKNLGQESYTQAQNEAEEYRNRMFECIQSKDVKCQQNIMVELNEWKARHEGDAESLKALVESWEADEDGDRPVSTDAMSKDDIAVMENFVANDSKRTIYEDGVMKYQWDVPVMVNGEPLMDENGLPVTEPKTYSLKDLQDKIILKDTVNGTKMLDYGVELKTSFSEDPDNPPSAADIKEKVSSIIPKDEKKIRDWLHGNPADRPGLDVHEYLIDLMEKDFNTFSQLGIDINNFPYKDGDGEGGEKDGVLDANDVPRDFKDDLIKKILNVEDLEISHDIISEIYAKHLQYDMVGRGKENKDYRKDHEKSILGSDIDTSKEAKEERANKLTQLQSLGDPSSPIHAEIASMSPEAIASHLGFESINSQIYNDQTGEFESISTYIASASKKTSKINKKNPKKSR